MSYLKDIVQIIWFSNLLTLSAQDLHHEDKIDIHVCITITGSASLMVDY